jgi:hypothetical protein
VVGKQYHWVHALGPINSKYIEKAFEVGKFTSRIVRPASFSSMSPKACPFTPPPRPLEPPLAGGNEGGAPFSAATWAKRQSFLK